MINCHYTLEIKKEEFDYIVAADGVYSKLNKFYLKEGLPKYLNSIALRGNIYNFENSDISLYWA